MKKLIKHLIIFSLLFSMSVVGYSLLPNNQDLFTSLKKMGGYFYLTTSIFVLYVLIAIIWYILKKKIDELYRQGQL